MTRDMVLNELPGKSIESICGAALLSCSRGATPMHWSHADVHARKMLCQQHRTTRTAPLIDFLGFAHVPRASPLQPRAVSACPPVHSASIYLLYYAFIHHSTPGPAFLPHPIEFCSIRRRACVQHRPLKNVARWPRTHRRRRGGRAARLRAGSGRVRGGGRGPRHGAGGARRGPARRALERQVTRLRPASHLQGQAPVHHHRDGR